MRLFVALDIDAPIRERIAEFRNRMRLLAPGVRWVQPETFHITLQFLGETSRVAEIKQALGKVVANATTVSFRNTGFFPNPRTPRVFWVGIEADEKLPTLAAGIGMALEPLGFERETGDYKPHLTLARLGSGRPTTRPGGRMALALQAVRAELEHIPPPDFGGMTAREFFLYESKLSPAGARYSKLARYGLENAHS
jgi:2'-5' RNA ligase